MWVIFLQVVFSIHQRMHEFFLQIVQILDEIITHLFGDALQFKCHQATDIMQIRPVVNLSVRVNVNAQWTLVWWEHGSDQLVCLLWLSLINKLVVWKCRCTFTLRLLSYSYTVVDVCKSKLVWWCLDVVCKYFCLTLTQLCQFYCSSLLKGSFDWALKFHFGYSTSVHIYRACKCNMQGLVSNNNGNW